jgi:hypothetical protein
MCGNSWFIMPNSSWTFSIVWGIFSVQDIANLTAPSRGDCLSVSWILVHCYCFYFIFDGSGLGSSPDHFRSLRWALIKHAYLIFTGYCIRFHCFC